MRTSVKIADRLQTQIVITKARLFWRFGNTLAAIETLQDARKKWPKDLYLIYNLAKFYRAMGDWDNFYNTYELFLSYDTGYGFEVDTMRKYGMALLGSYRYEEAVHKFKSVIEHWKLDERFSTLLSNTHACLGICYSYLDELDLAETALKTAQAVVSWEPDVLFGLIHLYLGTNRVEDIPILFDKLNQQKRKKNILYYLDYSKALYIHHILKDPEQALVWYKSALSKINKLKYDIYYKPYYWSVLYDFDPERILYDFIDALVEAGKTNEALWQIYWQKVRGLFMDYDVNAIRIYRDIRMGHCARAESACQRKLRQKLIPDFCHRYWVLLSQAQFKQGKFSDARKNILKAIEIDPVLSIEWDILGTLEMKENNWQAALMIYLRLVKEKPFEADLWQKLGKCYFLTKEFEQARMAYERAISLSPFDAQCWNDLGDIYSTLNQLDLAKSSYEKSSQYEINRPGKDSRSSS